MVTAFLDDPGQEPSSSCLAEMAQAKFEKPLSVADFKMEPVVITTNTGLGQQQIKTVIPEAWKEVAPGAYSPNGKITDQTVIMLQAAPIDPDTLLNLLKNQLKSSDFNVEFEQIGTRAANGIDWTIYSGEALIAAVDIALGEKDGMTYLILMQVPLSDRTVLREAVLLPVIDALQPEK
jgi:hypothetical protein